MSKTRFIKEIGMTVKELKDILAKYDDCAQVMVGSNDVNDMKCRPLTEVEMRKFEKDTDTEVIFWTW